MDDQYRKGDVGSGAFQKIKFGKFADKIVGYNLTTLILCTHITTQPAINTPTSSRKSELPPSSICWCSAYVAHQSSSQQRNLNCLATDTLQRSLLGSTLLGYPSIHADKNLLTNLRSLRKFLDRSLKILDLCKPPNTQP